MSKVLVKNEKGIVTISVNRPEAYNSLNKEIVTDLDKAVRKIQEDDSVKVLIIHSEKNFAAGADIKDMANCGKVEAKKFSFAKTFNLIATLDIPTIAVLEGYTLGGGLELALSCDFRIAALGVKMGFPETSLGIMPGAGGTIRAPRLLGESKALELILMNEIITSEEALRIGLINKISEPDKAMKDAMEWAEKLSTGAAVALKTAKKSIREGLKIKDLEKAVSLEADLWADLFETQDQKEGMNAFIEKRKPIYKGK